MDHELLGLSALESAGPRAGELHVAERSGGRAVAAAHDVVREDLEDRDRVRSRVIREQHVAALLVAARPARGGLDADLPVEDRLRVVVERRKVEQVALRALSVDVLKAVHVNALMVARRDEPVELDGHAVAFNVRVDPDLRASAAGEHVQALTLAIARRLEALEPQVEDAGGESPDADVADARAGPDV